MTVSESLLRDDRFHSFLRQPSIYPGGSCESIMVLFERRLTRYNCHCTELKRERVIFTILMVIACNEKDFKPFATVMKKVKTVVQRGFVIFWWEGTLP